MTFISAWYFLNAAPGIMCKILLAKGTMESLDVLCACMVFRNDFRGEKASGRVYLFVENHVKAECLSYFERRAYR